MQLLRDFYAYYRPWKKLFLLDFCCAVVAGLLELAFPLAVAYFIDTLLPKEEWNLIILASVGLLFVYLMRATLTVIVIYWGHMLGINIETEMRRKSFRSPAAFAFSLL
ncbi:MAG: ABC transporter transmembrane domain-containing protein [Thermomicrobiales bacterium]